MRNRKRKQTERKKHNVKSDINLKRRNEQKNTNMQNELYTDMITLYDFYSSKQWGK